MRNNTHDLSKDELAEVFNDAAFEYLSNGDRVGYVLRLQALGLANSEITENLRELDIKRAELFNQALAEREVKRGKATKDYRVARPERAYRRAS